MKYLSTDPAINKSQFTNKKNRNQKLYKEGSASLIVFVLILATLPLLLSYGLYTRLNNEVLKRRHQWHQSYHILQDASDAISRILRTQDIPKTIETIQTSYPILELEITDLSAKLNPYFVQNLIFELTFFQNKSKNNFTPPSSRLRQDMLKSSGLVQEHIPASLHSYFSEYSYININTDDKDMIARVLSHNGVELDTINTFLETVQKEKLSSQYLSPQQLKKALAILDNPISQVFTTLGHININSVDIELLESILGLAIFNVIDLEATIQKIERIRNNNQGSISNKQMRDLIQTNLGSELIFQYIGDSSWFYRVRACDKEYCIVRVLARSHTQTSLLTIVSETITSSNTPPANLESKTSKKTKQQKDMHL